MTKLSLTGLSDRQRDAWRMRYTYGWRTKRHRVRTRGLAERASKIIRRIQKRSGLAIRPYISVIRRKPRRVRAGSLSGAFNLI